jgi:type I restriction enzyme M protein
MKKTEALNEQEVLAEGMVLDYLTQKPLKDSPKERVRQEVIRALFHEYQISLQDMEADFNIPVEGRKRKKVELAIFEPREVHSLETLRRVVVCRPTPKVGRKMVIKLRDHSQAKEDLEELKEIMSAIDGCIWGLWTNGIEQFFIKKTKTRFEDRFEPQGDWPLGDESAGTPDVHSNTYLRKASEETLRSAFRRCHNFIHGNEGMPKDAAFWQFLYLIFSKMYDERQNKNGSRQFFAYPSEPFEEQGRVQIRRRIDRLFEQVKKEFGRDAHRSLFNGNEEITLSNRALAFMVAELAKYDLTRTEVDAKGAAYQEIVGTNLRGDRGQYFTPRRAIKLMVQILDPMPDERVLDPACGTGGFLVATIDHQLKRLKQEAGRVNDNGTTDEIRSRLANYTSKYIYGADFDPFLVRASTMNLMMAANVEGNIFHMDSLAFPNSHLPGNESAKKKIKPGSIDVLMTNPPFGSEIPITDPVLLGGFDLAQKVRRGEDGSFIPESGHVSSVSPEVLFIEKSIRWLREGGRMGIVLPNGILGNPGDEHIRRWILRQCFVLAVVEVPVEAFIVEANVGILTSLVFLKKKTQNQINAEDLGKKTEYPVFMAVAEKAGVDRRGNQLFKRNPDGTEILHEVEVVESRRFGNRLEKRILKRKEPILDDDFPVIAEAYKEFRKKNPEPGS